MRQSAGRWGIGPRKGALALAALLSAAQAGPVAAADPAGTSVALRYTTDLLTDVSGGLQHGTGWIGRLDLTVDRHFDVARISGAEVFVDLFLLHGTRFSGRFAGDAQTLSNIDAPHAIRPFEAWVRLPLANAGHIKAGLIDLNADFDVQAVGAPFLNSSFGIGPDLSQSGLNGPSIFPITSPAVVMSFGSTAKTVRFGIFDGEPGYSDHPGRFLPGPLGRDGALFIGEVGLPLAGVGRVQLGAWRYTDRFARLDSAGRASSGGAYGLIQKRIAGDDREGAVALRGWLRAGFAADAVNPIGLYVGGGLTYGSDTDLAGIAVAHARLGDPALRVEIGDRRAETAIEVTGQHKLNRYLSVQPDLQYIVHPSWRSETADALVLGLRFRAQWPPF